MMIKNNSINLPELLLNKQPNSNKNSTIANFSRLNNCIADHGNKNERNDMMITKNSFFSKQSQSVTAADREM